MKQNHLPRWICIVLLYLTINILYLVYTFGSAGSLWTAAAVAALLFYLLYMLLPAGITGRCVSGLSLRIRLLVGGQEQAIAAAVCLPVQIVTLAVMWGRAPVGIFWIDLAVSAVLLFLLGLSGILRVLLLTRQRGLLVKVLLFLLWWIPIVHLFVLWRLCTGAEFEYEVERNLLEKDVERTGETVCRTKYPILMVHGVFFRDWQFLNYWGRIVPELKKNGADVHYGRQQSALCVADSAEEIRRHILEVCGKTGSDKVNIIAHSKGGLDARYAISCLGMAPHVASLTTVSTPHQGCRWVDEVLSAMPDWFVEFVAKRYNRIFRRLGDDSPDFVGAVRDLTEANCGALNKKMKDAPGVYYQSYMSVMHSSFSAGFPLNFTYGLIRRHGQGDNDGLVPASAAAWGDFHGVIRSRSRRGVSHGDMIDLEREDIPGFEVREFYIQIVKKLKERGL